MRRVLAAMSLGVLIVYAMGAVQLSLFFGIGIAEAAIIGVLPFVTVDALKVLVASAVGTMFLRPA